jgi:hypothetical protein
MPWNLLPSSAEVLAVHSALVRSGHIVYFGGDEHDPAQNQSGSIDHTRLFDCATLVVSRIASPPFDVFCCGHAFLVDGRLLIAGGTVRFPEDHNGPHAGHFPGLRDTAAYNPGTRSWSTLARMNAEPGRTSGGGRWYPTLLTLENGQVLAVSGHPGEDDSRHNNDSAEMFSPTPRATGTWRFISGADAAHAMAYYPRAHVLPSGEVFFSTPHGSPRRNFRLRTRPYTWTDVCAPPPDPIYGDIASTSVLLPLLPESGYRPRVLISGGAQPYVVDLGAPAPAWAPTGPRSLAGNPVRNYANAILLPTGEVFVCGGVRTTGPGSDPTGVHEAEVYNPWTNAWTATPPATVVRNYHSVALLMPDGRVWTAGSNHDGQHSFPSPGTDNRELRIELWEPSYTAAARPHLGYVPPAVGWGQNFDVESNDAARIARIAFVRAGSATHAYDPDQRYVGAEFTRSGTQLSIKAPPTTAIAPPGYYLLVLVDSGGLPSVGRFIRIGPNALNGGFMVQGNFGRKGNFELVSPRTGGGMVHCWRNNDTANFPWGGPTLIASGAGTIESVPSLIQGNFGGNLEVVARIGDRLAHFWRDSAGWHGPTFFASGVSGNPSLIQGLYGGRGNFEVLAPLAGGGLAHFWRNNDDPSLPWSGPTAFAQTIGHFDAVGLVESNFGEPGNLEVVARVGDRLAHFWRNGAVWEGPTFFASGAAGVLGFIQSHFGNRGNFEVVTPHVSGGAVHFWRNNDAAGLPWSGPSGAFGTGETIIAVSLLEGNFGTPGPGGNLEAILRSANGNRHYWRQDRSPWIWTGPTAFPCS